jgi:hypothetical protein
MLVDTVLHSTAVAAGFEIGMLLRCARTGSGRHGRTVMEFSREDAARRLTTLLDSLALDAHRDEFAAGGWHQYTLHRVVSTGLSEWPLGRAWACGFERLCGNAGYQSARQRQLRADLAEAAWRAAVLSGGTRRRGGPLAVRVTDADLGLILVRAARVLDAPVSLRSVGSRHIVEVTKGKADVTLRQLAAS